MLARVSVLFLLTVGCCLGQTGSAVATRLKAEFKDLYAYAPPAPVDAESEVSGEPVLVLDPMVVTRSLGF